jgi:hypothetical protein
MKEEELIKKLEGADLPRIEVPSHRRRLRMALLQSSYFKERPKVGMVSLAKSKMKGSIDALTRGLGSRQPVWKTATAGMLAMVLVVLLFTELWTGAGADMGDRFHVIPNLDLSRYTVYEPEQRTGDPSAESPEYVFLIAGKEAVMLEGPEVKGEEYFFLENQQIRKVDHGYFEDYRTAGFEVTVNTHLSYTVAIEYFEDEVGLAEVRLGAKGNTITSTFTFAASESGDGVARGIIITAFIDGREVESKKVRSIEVRAGPRGEGKGEIEFSVRRASTGKETRLKPEEINHVPYADFAFVVDFDSSIKAVDEGKTLAVYLPAWKEWRTPSIQVFAREGLYFEPVPEADAANEVRIRIEILGDERVLVTPLEGDFPSQAQVVLKMSFGWFAPPDRPTTKVDYTKRVYVEER